MLKLMNRRHEDSYKIAQYIKNRDLILRTSLMTGFPGETEDDFSKMLQFVRQGYIDLLGVFTYSRVPNTPAYAMKNQIPAEIAMERANALIKEHRKHALKKMRSKIGEEYDAVFYYADNNTAIGRLIIDMAESDNKSFVQISEEPVYLGKKQKVKVTGVKNYEYEVKILDN